MGSNGNDFLCDLSRQGLIAVQGADAASFLQGQVTCDMRRLSPEHSRLGALCNPKGRMLALFRLFQRGEVYYLRLPQEMLEPTLKRLRLFVLRTKVTLEDASGTLARIGLAGPKADVLLQEILRSTPTRINDATQTRGITAIRLPGVQPRFELHGEAEALKEVWNSLARHAQSADAESWRLLDIQAGIPVVYPETSEAFLPQMVNLQLVEGVSFNKGCYTGQEVVARTQHLGKLKRRMYRAYVNTDIPLRPGDALFSPQADPGQDAGKIVEAALHPDGGYDLLAVVSIDCAEHGQVRVGSEHGAMLKFEPLPYALP